MNRDVRDARTSHSRRSARWFLVLALATGYAVSGSRIVAQSAPPSVGDRRQSPARTAAPQTWKLAARPVLEIGGSSGEGPTAFGQLSGVAVLRSGLLVVGDSRANELRVFDERGTFLRAFGRSGSGPGEFSRVLWSVHALGDTILATDNGARAQLFDASGRLLRALTRPAIERVARPERIGLLRNGAIAVRALEVRSDTSTPVRDASRIVLREGMGANGATYSRLARVADRARQPSPRSGSPYLYGPTLEVVAHDDRVCLGFSDRYRISCFSAIGAPLFTIDRASTNTPVTEDMRQLARDGYVNGNRAGASNDLLARLRLEANAFQFAERAPAFGRMLVAANGELWVSSFNPAERIIGPRGDRVSRAPVKWSVHDPRGAWIADIEVPPRVVPHAVANGHLYCVSLAEDDTESVTVWSIIRSSEPPHRRT